MVNDEIIRRAKRVIESWDNDVPNPEKEASIRALERFLGKVYLSGPMSGLPELNHPAFNAAATKLREAGYDVVNPAELDKDLSKKWTEYMREDIRHLLDCQKVFCLPGWESSRGASLEVFLATQLGMKVEALE